MTRTLKPLILNTSALTLTLILIYTGISAHDKLTWLMEVTPVIIVVPLLLATARRYPLAALTMVVPRKLFRWPISCRAATVMETLVAVMMVPMKSAL